MTTEGYPLEETTFDASSNSNCNGFPRRLWNSAGKTSKVFNPIVAAQYTDITFSYPAFTNPGKGAKSACEVTFYLYGYNEPTWKIPPDFMYTPIICDSATVTPRFCQTSVYTAQENSSFKAAVIDNYHYYADWKVPGKNPKEHIGKY